MSKDSNYLKNERIVLIIGLILSILGIVISIVATLVGYEVIKLSINSDITFVIGVIVTSIGIILLKFLLH